MIVRTLSLLAIALAAPALILGSSARADERGTTRQSAEDARELAALAPPARHATDVASYGDARTVRPHAHRASGKELGADAPVGLFYCPDDKGRPTHELCARDPARVGFRDFYLYTPSYATSPQVRRDGRGRDPSLLPPATAFFYSANNFLFGNPAGE